MQTSIITHYATCWCENCLYFSFLSPPTAADTIIINILMRGFKFPRPERPNDISLALKAVHAAWKCVVRVLVSPITVISTHASNVAGKSWQWRAYESVRIGTYNLLHHAYVILIKIAYSKLSRINKILLNHKIEKVGKLKFHLKKADIKLLSEHVEKWQVLQTIKHSTPLYKKLIFCSSLHTITMQLQPNHLSTELTFSSVAM